MSAYTIYCTQATKTSNLWEYLLQCDRSHTTYTRNILQLNVNLHVFRRKLCTPYKDIENHPLMAVRRAGSFRHTMVHSISNNYK